MYSTTKSNRIAFYEKGVDEYVRMAEDPLQLQMTAGMSNLDYIDTSADGDTLFFSGAASGDVSAFSVNTGEFKYTSCSKSMLGTTLFTPGAFRVSPYTDYSWVADIDSVLSTTGTQVRRYLKTCTGAPEEIVFSVPGFDVHDIAFGSRDMAFFFGRMWQAPWSGFGTSADLGMRIYSLNLTKLELELPDSIVLVKDIDAAWNLEPTGFEALEDNAIFLSLRYSTSFVLIKHTGVPNYLGTDLTMGSLLPTVGNFDATRDGSIYFGQPQTTNPASGAFEWGGGYYPPTGDATTGSYAPGVPTGIDAWSVRRGPNNLLYVADYSFGLPWVIHPVSGRTIGRLGSSFGMLAQAHHMAFHKGPYGVLCDTILDTSDVKAGQLLTLAIELYDSSGAVFCGDPSLTAVQSGYTWFGEAPTFNSEISTFSNWERDGSKCHRWSIKIPGEVASLVHTNGNSDQVIDPRLKSYCEGRTCDFSLYHFTVTVYLGKKSFGVVGGLPKTYSVAPSTPSADETELVDTMIEAASNETNCATVDTRDEFGNYLLYGGSASAFSFKMDSEDYIAPDQPGAEVDSVGLPIHRITVKDLNNGEYGLCVTSGPSGVHFMSVLLSDGNGGEPKEIKASPISIVVTPGDAVGKHTVASGIGVDYINEKDGAENVFYVIPKDSRGNMLPASDLSKDMLYVSIEYNPVGSSSSSMNVDWSTSIEADGRFKVVYSITGSLEEDSEYKSVRITAKIRSGSLFETIMVDREGGEEALEELEGLSVIQGSRLIHYKMSTGLKVTLYLECAILIALCLATIGLVKYWENENAIKFSQRKFLYIMLAGILLMYISFLLLIVDYDDDICAAENFIFHIGIWVTLIPIVAKTYRTNKIANNRGLKRVKITDGMLLRGSAGVLVFIILLLILQCVFYPAKAVVNKGSPTLQDSGVTTTYIVTQCTAGVSPMSLMLFTGELGVIVYLAVLAHFTRKVPSAFAEAKYIALSIYNLCLIIAFLGIMVGIVGIDTDYPELFFGITGFAMFMGVGVMQVMIFVPKFVIIIRKKEVKLEDILVEGRGDEKRGSKNRLEMAAGGNPMGELRRPSNSGVFRGASSRKMGGSGVNIVGSSLAMGSMATQMEVDERTSSDKGKSEDKSTLSGQSSEGEVGSLKSELERLRALEKQLKRDNQRQQSEIDKMKELNKKLTQSHRSSVSRSASFVIAQNIPSNSNWVPLMDDEGKTYYYNTKTFECSYDVPKKW